MAVFLLYFLAGVFTAFHLFFLLTWSALGGQANVLEYVALGGAALLIISSYTSLWKPNIASQLALGASLAEWAFYLPAVRTAVHGGFMGWHSRAGLYAAGAITLLIAATIYAAIRSFKNRSVEVASRSTSTRMKFLAVGLSSIAFVGMIGGLYLIGRSHQQQRFTIVLPSGYQGWVRIDFGLGGKPRLQAEDGKLHVRVPSSGVVETSTVLLSGVPANTYHYAGSSDQVQAQAFLVRKAGSQQQSEYIAVGQSAANASPGPDGMPVPGATSAARTR